MRLAAAAALLACACGVRAAEPEAERARLAGTLVYVSERAGRREVFAVRAAGGAPRRLAALPGADVYPGPASPDGRLLALVSARGPREDLHEEALWVLDLEPGAEPRHLFTAHRVRDPVFTADSRAVLVEADLASFADLYRVAVSDGALARLTRASGGSFEPAPTAGGDLLFTSSRDGVAQIYRMRADGTETRRLTDSGAEDLAPLVSPTGALVLFTSSRDGRDRLYLMKPDGTGVRPLNPPADGEELAPAWSPDGARVAYLVRTAGETRLWVTEVASGARRPLGAAGHRDDQPVFSPDGGHVAFVSERDGNTDLYVARVDGSAVARITDDPAADWLPRWLPTSG